MTTCPSCSTAVSERAYSCPTCGEPFRMEELKQPPAPVDVVAQLLAVTNDQRWHIAWRFAWPFLAVACAVCVAMGAVGAVVVWVVVR